MGQSQTRQALGGWGLRIFPGLELCSPSQAETTLFQIVSNDVDLLSPVDHDRCHAAQARPKLAATAGKPQKRCTAHGLCSAQRLAKRTLHIQNVVAIELDIEKVERIPTAHRLDGDAGPIDQIADRRQEAVNVDGMPSCEAKIRIWRVLSQSTTLYENRQVRLANPLVRHAVQGVTNHGLDPRKAPRTHRDLVARCQSFDRPITFSRQDLRTTREATAALVRLVGLIRLIALVFVWSAPRK